MDQGEDHSAERFDPSHFSPPNLQRAAAQQMNERVVLRQRIRQLDHISEKKGKRAAGAAGLRFVGIGIGETTIEIERETAYPFDTTQRRWRAETFHFMKAGLPLQHRRELLEVGLASKQAPVMT